MTDKARQVQLLSEGKTLRLVLPGDFRIEAAKGLAALISRALRKKPEALIMDATTLERVDTAALQALVVAWQAAREAGIAARWEGCTANLVGSARLVGLAAAAGMEP